MNEIKRRILHSHDGLGGGEILYSREQTLEHIKRNYRTSNLWNRREMKKRKCGDGRDNSFYGEGVFGGDIGYEMITLAAMRILLGNDVTNAREIAEFTLDILADGGRNYAHSDSHTPLAKLQKTKTPGCGHFREAWLNPAAYGLTSQDLETIDELTGERNFEITDYEGGHQEGAVVIVEDPNIAVRALDIENNTSVFIINEGRIRKRLDQLAGEFAKKYHLKKKDVFRIFYEQWNSHTKTTKNILAPNKEVFILREIKNGTPVLT